jgi:ABC-type transporter Mla MlaB component
MAKKKVPSVASPSGETPASDTQRGDATHAAAPALAAIDGGVATAQAAVSPVAVDEGALLLDANLSIQFVNAAHRQLADIWARSEPAIDVSRVMTIDTAGIQLLLAVIAQGADLDTPLRVEGYSGAISNALSALGMQGMIPMAPRNADR